MKTDYDMKLDSHRRRRVVGIAAVGLGGAAALVGAGCQLPGDTDGRRPTATAQAQLIPVQSSGDTSGAASSDLTSASPSVGNTAASTTPPSVNSSATQSAAAMQNAFEQVARTAEPAVVTITTLKRIPVPRQGGGGAPFPFGFGSPEGGRPGGGSPLDESLRRFGGGGGFGPGSYTSPEAPGTRSAFRATQGQGPLVGSGIGSGFLVRPDGLIITNAHVVQDADTVTVKLGDGREFRNAKVLGQDTRTDIAVVKIPATNLPTLALGDSDRVRVGDWAIAVGNPFGLEHTVTVGVISAKAREVPLSENGPGEYLQTDASINPGNSGGPLLDIHGRVIGVNNAIYSQSGGNVGIGFAIPIDRARQIADTLAAEGRIRRARLGVAVSELRDQAVAFGLPAGTRGVLVESVDPNGPAARAGLLAGDVIQSFNGQAVTESSDFQSRVTAGQIGSNVTMEVLRGGKKQTITAKLEELRDPSAMASRRETPGADAENQPTRLGVGLAPLTPEIANRLGIRGKATGVVIAQVQPGSPAQIAGLRPGDVIQRVGQTAVTAPADVKRASDQILAKQTGDQRAVALYVIRGGQGQYIVVGL
jgi:serine protease Do